MTTIRQMQSLDPADGGVTITRAASQQMMHYSLTAGEDRATPLCGRLVANRNRCIHHIDAPRQHPDPTSQSSGIWISHPGLHADALADICQQHAPDKLVLLLDCSHKGRMDLQAARLDPETRQLQPVEITMVEG